MSEPNLSELGVNAQSIEAVEDVILASAEVQARTAEAQELESNIEKLDQQLQTLRTEEAVLLKSSFSTQKNRRLNSIQGKIRVLEGKKRKLFEASEARQEIVKKTNAVQSAIADDERKPGETQLDFLVRTGRVTPFQDQFSYKGKTTVSSGVIRRRVKVSLQEAHQSDGEDDFSVETGNGSSAKSQRASHTQKYSSEQWKRSKANAPDEEDEYCPNESEEEPSSSEDDSWSIDVDKPAKKKRKVSIEDIVDFADEEREDKKSEDSVQGLKEGDDWVMADEEEVELEGGLRMPCSIYDKLFDYQKTGVQWLWELHAQGTGGILGDEMGLGKTIQIVAFLAALNYSGQLPGSVLIMAPTTVMRQWLREFRAWWPRFRVRILHHSYEPQTQRNKKKRRVYSKYNPEVIVSDVVNDANGVLITSYEQVRKNHGMLVDRFDYVIADEGHKMKSPDAEVTIACKRFDTPHRIILSGSPLQNHLKELWSLFDFVFPGKLGTLPIFQEQFVVPITMGGYATASKSQVHTAYKCSLMLRDLISPFLLRRLKKDVAKQLPEKNEQILFVRLTAEQREKYKKFLKSRFVRQVLQGKLNLLYAITALRKVCNHCDIPLFHNDHDADISRGIVVLEKAGHKRKKTAKGRVFHTVEEREERPVDYGNWKRSGKLIVLNRVLEAWQSAKSRVLIFSQTRTMLDILESFVKERNYTYQRMDGETPIGSRMDLIDNFNNNETVFIFLLTTRVGGLGVNLTGADRVVLYDPDWNPSIDLQARERAWRVGQTKPVTIYRFITTGTIEEKIYHRQIYKQFMTNKVLSDPRQRRFFKPKDIKDLFTLVEDDENGTETGDIFSGTNAKEVKASKANNFSKANDLREVAEVNTGEAEASGTNAPEDGNAKLLNSLLENLADGQLSSTMNHDAILNAGNEGKDVSVIEYEANKIAREAMEELKRSARRRRRTGIGVPTWTGKSGLAGYVNRPSRNGQSRASALLSKIAQREGGAAMNPGATDSKPSALLLDLVEFFKGRGRQCSSAEVVESFKSRVQNSAESLQQFKSLLKQIATLVKGAGPNGSSVWRLNNNFD
ncbi:unnamed protein product [Agarophyton chilense]